MSIKSAEIATSAKPKEAKKVKEQSEIQVAKISSYTTIQVTRAQVICTVVAALLTLSGVVIANLDKFSSSAPIQPMNKLLVQSKAQRVHDFMEKNQEDTQTAQTTLLKIDMAPLLRETVIRVLDSYKVHNQESTREFIKETTLLDQAVQTNNAEAIEVSRQRLNQISIRDASNLQDTIHKLNQTLRPVDIFLNHSNKIAEEPGIEKLWNRKPVKELATLLPIKREISQDEVASQFAYGRTAPFIDLSLGHTFENDQFESGTPENPECSSLQLLNNSMTTNYGPQNFQERLNETLENQRASTFFPTMIDRRTVSSEGNVGIGTKAPNRFVSVSGNTSMVDRRNWAVFSDDRLKNIATKIDTERKAVTPSERIHYEYKSRVPPHIHFGVSIRVSQTDNSCQAINNNSTIWTMLDAIKEQQKEIHKLQTEIRWLRGN